MLFLVGCDRNPIRKLIDANQEGAQGNIAWTSPFVIYKDDLESGGGAMLYPDVHNQTVSFFSTNNPRGKRSIFYSWNGRDIMRTFDPCLAATPVLQHEFAGLSLTVASGFDTFDTTLPRNLFSGGYTKITLWVRGRLTTNTILRIEGPDDGLCNADPPRLDITASQLTDDWQQITIPIPTSSFLISIKDFVKFTFVYNQPPSTTAAGEGGEIFIDDVAYEK